MMGIRATFKPERENKLNESGKRITNKTMKAKLPCQTVNALNKVIDSKTAAHGQNVREFNFNAHEKRSAQIIDQLCAVFIEGTRAHVGPELFKRLTLRLSEMLEPDEQVTAQRDELLAACRALIREDGHYIECPAPNNETHEWMPQSKDVERCKRLQAAIANAEGARNENR